MPTLKDLPPVAAVLKEGGKRSMVIVGYVDYKKFLAKLEIEGQIDEADYLKKHPDIAKAVTEGKLKSGTDHYKTAGYLEQRVAKVVG